MDCGGRVRALSNVLASSASVGDADIIVRALSTVAWILARLRMIEASCTSRSTSGPVIAATSVTSKPAAAAAELRSIPKQTARHERASQPVLIRDRFVLKHQTSDCDRALR